MPSVLPDHPWQKLGADLFKHKLMWYLLVIDYYSRYLELKTLKGTRFSNHWGIARVYFCHSRSSRDTLYRQRIITFANKRGFTTITQSPEFSQDNGLPEIGVKITKKILDAPDPHLALFSHRRGYSLAELLFNRRLRSLVPMMPFFLQRNIQVPRLNHQEPCLYDNVAVYGYSFWQNYFSLLAPVLTEDDDHNDLESVESQQSSLPKESPEPATLEPQPEHNWRSSAHQGEYICPPLRKSMWYWWPLLSSRKTTVVFTLSLW